MYCTVFLCADDQENKQFRFQYLFFLTAWFELIECVVATVLFTTLISTESAPVVNITFDEESPLYQKQKLFIYDNNIALEEERFTMSLTPVTSGVKVETGSCYWETVTITIVDDEGMPCTNVSIHNYYACGSNVNGKVITQQDL